MSGRQPDPHAALVAAWRADHDDRDLYKDILEWITVRIRSRPDPRLWDKDQASALAQEAVVRAWVHLESYDEQAHFRYWVWGIAKNVIKEYYRKHGLEYTPSTDEMPEEEFEDPEAVAIRRMVAQDAVAALTPDERRLLDLRHEDGLTCNKIGEMLGKSGNAVQLAAKRAEAKIGAYLRENGWE